MSREDYDWILERYAWPSGALRSRHDVTDRETIAWSWPHRLEVPVEGGGRIAVLRARSEDAWSDIFVVETDDGSHETRDREDALRLCLDAKRRDTP